MNTHTHTFWLTSSGVLAVRDGACIYERRPRFPEKKQVRRAQKPRHYRILIDIMKNGSR